eukprot:5329217-Heterocapsa_arctica.AAC.1
MQRSLRCPSPLIHHGESSRSAVGTVPEAPMGGKVFRRDDERRQLRPHRDGEGVAIGALG